ncbi:uncharacterized protein LOC132619609 [Lycium barbarum]|uniref:uncharacterized protein LOC132619609 n=1 Tax=Lycium barbarum TaxID=112863 RepID=UPI00293EFB1F|nr:uncharacterized protein LOC132619609 [Lycium barbarum]
MCVVDCSLHDLKSSGAFYTWNNKHVDGSRVYSRIDRVLVNGVWLTSLPSSEVHYGNEGVMDHCPAIISWDTGQQTHNGRFNYFNMWSQDLIFQQLVKENMERDISGTQMYKLVGKLNRLKSALRSLNRTQFKDVELTAEKAKKELDACQTTLQLDPRNISLIEHEVQLRREYQNRDKARKQFLVQKCKMHWLAQGDMNTKYFHSMLKTRRNTNRIFNIKDSQGVTRTDIEGIDDAFVEFYSSLLGT